MTSEFPFRITLRDGRVRDATLIEGPGGWGECSPLPGFHCDPAAARAAAEEAAAGDWPAAVRTAIAVNALVGGDRFDAAALRGFSTVKVKVGDAGEVDRVARVRDALGPHARIRIDANGAWDEDTAVDRIGALARYDLEFVEEPVHGLDALARVRAQVAVPIAVDESVRSVEDAQAAAAAADIIVVKVQPCGGVRAALRWADAFGGPAVVTSMMETSVGLRAGVALAAALPELPYACGLGTATELVADVTSDPLVPIDGVVAVRPVVPDLIERSRQ
ncbi:MAG: enolase C-terminal domain-like protein [Acidimicrobiia bacterium]